MGTLSELPAAEDHLRMGLGAEARPTGGEIRKEY